MEITDGPPDQPIRAGESGTKGRLLLCATFLTHFALDIFRSSGNTAFSPQLLHMARDAIIVHLWDLLT